MAPILYKVDASPPANVVRMLADIIGLQLDLKDVDLMSLEHKGKEYKKMNPLGTIPTLVDDDFALSDSHTIMKYLLTKYGADKSELLYPSDLRTRALIDQAMFFNTGVYFIKLKNVSLPTIFGDLPGPTDKQVEEIEDCYAVVESYLEGRKYVAADHLTLADLAVGATTNAMQPIHKLDGDKFPRTVDWLSRLEEESFFKKIMIPGSKILGQFLNSCWEKNRQK